MFTASSCHITLTKTLSKVNKGMILVRVFISEGVNSIKIILISQLTTLIRIHDLTKSVSHNRLGSIFPSVIVFITILYNFHFYCLFSTFISASSDNILS